MKFHLRWVSQTIPFVKKWRINQPRCDLFILLPLLAWLYKACLFQPRANLAANFDVSFRELCRVRALYSTSSRAAVHPCSLCALFKTSSGSAIQARPFLPDLQPRSAPSVRPSAAPASAFALCSPDLRDTTPPLHIDDHAPVASARPWHSDILT
jgi:hypothetical protein